MKNTKLKSLLNENSNDNAIKSFMNKISVHIGDRYDVSTKRYVLNAIKGDLKQLILTITGYNV